MSRASTPTVESAAPELEKVAPVEEDTFLHGRALAAVVIGLLLSIFLIAIDQTIVANALPVIASKFNALDQISWIPTAFLLTQAPMLLVWGQLNVLFPTKWIFMLTVSLFEIGSLLSGVATSVDFLIFARAFQGVGAAGIFVCAISIMAEVIPLHNRPKFMGLFGALFGVSSILGPLLGGAFVDHVSWRWCFYINLPLSVPTFWFVGQFVKAKPAQIDRKNPPPPIAEGEVAWKVILKRGFGRLARLDWIGSLLVVGATTSLVLAITWGGNTKPWSAAPVIATFVVFGVVAIIFIAWQWFRGPKKALMPLFLFRNRTQVGACLAGMFTRMAFFAPIYYLPLYFQAVKGHSPVKSGLDLIPITLATVFTAATGGFIISKTGRYWYLTVGGPLVGIAGFSLMFTLDEHSSWGKIIGYQILMGISIGTTLQNTILAIQADISKDMVPQATGLVTFSQFIGGIIGIAVGGAIFQNKLASGLRIFAPDAPFDQLRLSVAALRMLPPDQRAGAIHAYVKALQWAIGIVGAVASVLTSVSATMIRNIDIRQKKPGAAPSGPGTGATTPVENVEPAQPSLDKEEREKEVADRV